MAKVRVGEEGALGTFPLVKKQRCAEAFIVGSGLETDELIVVNSAGQPAIQTPLIAYSAEHLRLPG
ncbi:hypothetical protein C2E19_19060 [Pseudomonas sp. DTU12.3]|nr:hypothetical protein C2E19_19060 [Pseudomonas sp. DTU12.3]